MRNYLTLVSLLLSPAIVYVGARNLSLFFPTNKLLPELSKDVHIHSKKEINREAAFNFSVCQKGGTQHLPRKDFWNRGVPHLIFQETF